MKIQYMPKIFIQIIKYNLFTFSIKRDKFIPTLFSSRDKYLGWNCVAGLVMYKASIATNWAHLRPFASMGVLSVKSPSNWKLEEYPEYFENLSQPVTKYYSIRYVDTHIEWVALIYSANLLLIKLQRMSTFLWTAEKWLVLDR